MSNWDHTDNGLGCFFSTLAICILLLTLTYIGCI